MKGSRQEIFRRHRGGRARSLPVFAILFALVVATYVAGTLLESADNGVIDHYLALSIDGLGAGMFWQIFTHPFATAGIFETVMALLVLAYAGRDLESLLGGPWFLLLFLLSSAAYGLSMLILVPNVFVAGLMPISCGLLFAHCEALPSLALDMGGFPWVRSISTRFLSILYFAIGAVGVSLAVGSPAPLGAFSVMGLGGWMCLRMKGFGRSAILQPGNGSPYRPKRRIVPPAAELLDTHEYITEIADPILEKIFVNGLDSLTDDEREQLKSASKRIATREVGLG
jgi:membrane associated rhomboid family serine protease